MEPHAQSEDNRLRQQAEEMVRLRETLLREARLSYLVAGMEDLNETLGQELRAAKEELLAAKEEIQAAKEELQATEERIQAAKDKIQAAKQARRK